MSYTPIILDPTPIILYYDIERFFNLSSIESMYRTEQEFDASGASRLDVRSLTNNDKQFFDLLLKRSASECFKVLQPLAKGVVEGFAYNALPVRTVEQLNVLEAPAGDIYLKMSNVGTLDLGTVAVAVGDIVSFINGVWAVDNSVTMKYIFFTLSLPVYFDFNNQQVMDIKVEELLTLYVVQEWFKRQHYDLALIAAEFTEVRADLGRIINYRTAVKRKYRTF